MENAKMSKSALRRLLVTHQERCAKREEERKKIQLFQELLSSEKEEIIEEEPKRFRRQAENGEGVSNVENYAKTLPKRSVGESPNIQTETDTLNLKKLYSPLSLSKLEQQLLEMIQTFDENNDSKREGAAKKKTEKKRSRRRKLKEMSQTESNSELTEESVEEEIVSLKSNTDSPRSYLDDHFRHYVTRELTKHGRDVKWFSNETKKVLRQIDEKLSVKESKDLECVSSVAREVSDFLIRSNRSYFRVKTKKSPTARKMSPQLRRKPVMLKREQKQTTRSAPRAEGKC